MPVRPCPQVSNCPPEDISGNFSSEANDTLDYISTFFGSPPPRLGKQWDSTLCGVTFISDISQADADTQAAAAGLSCSGCVGPECQPPPPGTTVICNAPQTCCVPCGDGSNSCFTVPGGLFCNFNNQQEADGAAHNIACTVALAERVCISNLAGCTCVNTDYSATLTASGIAQWSITGGSLPPGLVFAGGIGTTTTISGQAQVSGQFTFQVQAQSPTGAFVQKTFTITVLSIDTTALGSYTVGTPYSFQLVASGGSGNYNWAITSGSLPDGLAMNLTGLVTGTPTGLNTGVQPITFKVIDLTCEAADQSFFPPRITMTTKSTTQIATLYGYSEYIPSSPPKKYHTITWSGQSEQTSVTWSSKQQLSDAKIVYSGSGTVDGKGNQVSNYRKDLYIPCAASNFLPFINSVPAYGLNFLYGYCWPPDPKSCPTCDPSLQFKSNIAANSEIDVPGFANAALNPIVFTPTSLTDTSTDSNLTASVEEGGIGGVTPGTVPLSNVNGVTTTWILLAVTNNYSAVLSNEYTDAEALANAVVIPSNGATAENFPRGNTFVSRTTNVVFTLSLSNLIKGQSYLVTVNFRDQNFNVSQKQYGVMANGSTATVTDVIATPAAGGTLTVFGPSVAFSP